MRNKFKMMTVAITIFMMITALAGCGTSSKSVKGESFDGGNIEVFVPEGWMLLLSKVQRICCLAERGFLTLLSEDRAK